MSDLVTLTSLKGRDQFLLIVVSWVLREHKPMYIKRHLVKILAYIFSSYFDFLVGFRSNSTSTILKTLHLLLPISLPLNISLYCHINCFLFPLLQNTYFHLEFSESLHSLMTATMQEHMMMQAKCDGKIKTKTFTGMGM